MEYKTDEQRTALLKNPYYVKHFSSGRNSLFHYISKVLEIETVPRAFIAEWLSKQKSQQLYAKPKPKTNIRPTISKRQGGIIQIDLIDYSNKKYQGYAYILNIIDVFSRKCWLVALKNKEADTINTNLKKLLMR